MGWVETKADDAIGKIAAVFTEESERTRLAFAQAMAETVRGSRIDGALARPVQTGAVNYAAAGRLVGWALRVAGGPAALDLFDGPGPDPSRYVASISLPSDGAASTVSMMPGGVSFTDSLFVAQTSGAGTVTGALWIGAVD